MKNMLIPDANLLSFVPEDGDLEEFLARVMLARRRQIQLLESPEINGPNGFWRKCEKVDYIVYPASAVRTHRINIICHEIAHMLLGHDSKFLTQTYDTPLATNKAASHMGYKEEDERAAETLGSLLAVALHERKSATGCCSVDGFMR